MNTYCPGTIRPGSWVEGRRFPGHRETSPPERIILPLKTRLLAYLTLAGTERGHLELWTDHPGPGRGVAFLAQDDVPYALAAIPLDACGDPGCANAGLQLTGQNLAGPELLHLLKNAQNLPWADRNARHTDEVWQPSAH